MPERGDRHRDRAPDELDRLRPLFGELARLDEDDPEWRRCRERLITGYMPIVEHAVDRYAGLRGADHGDLMEVGAIALVHAIDRFDPDSGGDFLICAVPIIVGELSRYAHSAAQPEHSSPGRAADAGSDQSPSGPVAPADIASRLGVSHGHVSEVLAAWIEARTLLEPQTDRPDGSTGRSQV
jgi:RNA polymerase sigma-B factor